MIHSTAIVDSKAEIDSNVKIGPYSIIEADVKIESGTVVGPHVVIQPYVTIGPDCKIFQFASIGAIPQALKFKGEKTFVRIGSYAYVGGKSRILKDIPPYVLVSGEKAKLYGLNRVGLKRQGFSEETLISLKRAYRILFRIGLTLNEAIERVKAEVEPVPEVNEMIDFIMSSKRGLTR